jgi:hypothetical protein
MTEKRIIVSGLNVDYPGARVVNNLSFTWAMNASRWWANLVPVNQ